uniref:Transposase-associated domain-containing protein n=1 Tax=Cucumis melo TaxID=3656 RepID=A0A9I9EGR9_CUCME
MENMMSKEYELGVEVFIQFGFRNGKGFSTIRCPCLKCGNRLPHEESIVRYHLYANGIDQSYKILLLIINAFELARKKKPLWKAIKCPKKGGIMECGYYVMRFMRDIILSSNKAILKYVRVCGCRGGGRGKGVVEESVDHGINQEKHMTENIVSNLKITTQITFLDNILVPSYR